MTVRESNVLDGEVMVVTAGSGRVNDRVWSRGNLIDIYFI